jgi:hypothetical protein
MSGTIAGLAMGSAVALGMPALGVAGIPVWDVQLDTSVTTYGANSYVQPNGDAIARGDNVHLQAGTPRGLASIVIPIGLYSASTTYQYTATDLRVMVYNVDSGGLPTTLLGTASTSATFTASNNAANGGSSRPALYNVTQLVAFNFESQNITLPDDFAFEFDDFTPSPDINLSNWLQSADSTDAFNSTPFEGPDQPVRHHLRHHASDNSWEVYSAAPAANWPDGWNMAAQVNVPEPASFSILAGAGLLALARRRRQA